VLALGALTAGSRAGKSILSAASLTLTVIFVQCQFPGFWAGAQAVLGRVDDSDALVWYRIDERGAIECHDGPGFHPVTRDELKPISPDIVRRVVEGARPPER